jgi:hypothetical protein
MLHIRPLEQADIKTVCRLAREVWQSTYASLISQAQIDFMLAARYAPDSLLAQMEDSRHCWRLAVLNEEIIGFAHAVMDGSACKLDKLYLRARKGISCTFVTSRKFAGKARRGWCGCPTPTSRNAACGLSGGSPFGAGRIRVHGVVAGS